MGWLLNMRALLYHLVGDYISHNALTEASEMSIAIQKASILFLLFPSSWYSEVYWLWPRSSSSNPMASHSWKTCPPLWFFPKSLSLKNIQIMGWLIHPCYLNLMIAQHKELHLPIWRNSIKMLHENVEQGCNNNTL